MAARKRSGGGIVALVILALLVGGGVWVWRRIAVGGEGIPITLSAAQLQSGLQQAFPVEKKELFLTVRLSDPTVALDPADGERIGFGAAVGVDVRGRKMANGTVAAAGKLRYEPESGTFYLDDPEIKTLDIDRVSGGLSGSVKKAVTYVLKKAVRHLPVYQLDTTDTVQKYARKGIRSVRVVNGAVEIRLGMNP